jgi:L-ascorbate metabolism protein UlaG (beta-lactamase superfamily)
MTSAATGGLATVMTMRVTRLTHACVRFERDGRVLVIDPGVWSEPDALSDADAVLLTHEHADHADILRLRGLHVDIVAPDGAALPGLETQPSGPGASFTVAGFTVTAVGGVHAPVLADQAPCPNLGYVVDDAVYHPGDALHVPGDCVETVLVPMHGSWLKTGEAVDFLRAAAPARAIGIHDGQINDRAVHSVGRWLGSYSGVDYRWVAPGTTI